MMGLRTTLSLLVIVGLLLLALLFTREKPDEKGSVSVSLLAGHRLASAVRLQWQFAETPPVEVRRTPGDVFRITLPIEDLVSMANFTAIAQAYDSAMIGETPLQDTPENRAKTGLASPRLVLDVEFEDGQRQHLEFGSEGHLGTDVFVRRDGQIYRGGLALVTSMQLGIDDLRERQVFRTPPRLCTEVEVDRKLTSGEREVLRLRRRGDGWEMTSPIEAPADANAAEVFVRNLVALAIDMFPQGPLVLPEGAPDLGLRVNGTYGEEKVELWIDSQQNVYGRIEGRKISFRCANSQYFTIFVDCVEPLRARVLVPTPDLYHQMVSMLVDFGADQPRLSLVRSTPDMPWAMQEPVRGVVEATAVQQLLTAVNNLQARVFLPRGTDPKACDLRTDGLRVTVQGLADQVPTTIRLGADFEKNGEDLTYAMRAEGLTEIVGVPRGAVNEIRRPWTAYLPLRIFTITDLVTRIDLVAADGRSRRLMRDENGVWADGNGGAIDAAMVADAVDHIRDLAGKKAMLANKLAAKPGWTLLLARRDDPPGVGSFGALDVWDEVGKPLVVRNQVALKDAAFELSPISSGILRGLWK